MIILSHRGYWKSKEEKNTLLAFKRSFELGFGTETDVRDYNGELVISHDIASEPCLKLEELFQLYKSYNSALPLAINIKSDELQSQLQSLIIKYDIQNYFVFDMSVPDGLKYFKKKLQVFTRQSEYEKTPAYYHLAQGIWLDEFFEHWINKQTLLEHRKNLKKCCIVSPELHGRDHSKVWLEYKNYQEELEFNNFMLCTDYPEEARNFFHGTN